MMRISISGGLLLAVGVLLPGLLTAQHPTGIQQLSGFPPQGGLVAPYFDGWYENPDGSVTLSFGYMNRNTEEVVQIPTGDNNRISPAEFDGVQPEIFFPVSYGNFSGRRERGVFVVTLPPARRNEEVVWTISHAGESYSVPGRTWSSAYQLSEMPRGMGTLSPTLSFEESGPTAQGRKNFTSAPRTARVGVPLTLDVWAEDQGVRENRVAVNMVWQEHRGPARVEFAPRNARLNPGAPLGTTSVTFSEPGDYVLRVRIDNFTIRDSRFSFQCCWTNGYVPVRVTE